MSAPTIGLALIVRDEEKQLPRLLASIEGAFDQVALLDTGSKDRTVAIFRRWAKAQKDLRWQTADFKWIDDFGAARRAADELLDTDWQVWADADDTIRGAENLRSIVAQTPPEIDGLIFGYEYAHDAAGNVCCHLKRERVVRAGAGRWEGRVHEAQTIEGGLTEVPAEMCCWIHQPLAEGPDSNERNLRILRNWEKEEPENPRVLGYIGTEELIRGNADEALGYFERYLELRTGWDEERAQVHRKHAVALISVGRHEEAIDTALEAVRVLPEWPDSYLSLAEAYYQLGSYPKAASWARDARRRGQPETLLIINPLDYTFKPLMVLASALGAMGQLEEAIEVAEEALGIVPDHEQLREGLGAWSGLRKREVTAGTWVGAAQMLIGHDEQLKALVLLDTVPYYATDHPQVVAVRSMLRERLGPLIDRDGYVELYRAGAYEAEEPQGEQEYAGWAAKLPRSRFLLDGLREQLGTSG